MKVQLVALNLLLVLLLASCAPGTAPAPAPQAPGTVPAPAAATSAPAAQAPAKQAWQQQWENAVEGAKKEGMVIVYASNAEFREIWSVAMQRYGVKLETIIGRPQQFAEKILTERRAGIYAADIFSGGTTTPLTMLKPKGALESMDAVLILPEVKDPKLWFEERLPYIDKDQTLLGFFLLVYNALGINTDLVKPGDVKSYNDLLNPKYRGKVIMQDPTVTGTKFTGVVSELMGWDYMRKLAESKPVIINDYRLQMEWLAHGKAAICIAPQAATLTGFRNIGAPVAPLIPQEGSWLSVGQGGSALFDRAPHRNAATVFLNWLLSKEGQTVTSKAAGSQSARIDVPTDFLDPVLVRNASTRYVRPDTEDYLVNKQPEVFKTAEQVFKDLLR